MSKYNSKAWETRRLEDLYNKTGWSENRLNLIYLLQEYSNDDFLDIGCLDGAYIKRIRELGYTGKYKGIDVTTRHIKISRENVPGEDFSVGDARDLKFKNKSFKTVLFSDVIQHLPEPVGPLNEACRVAEEYVILSTYGSRDKTFTRHNSKFMNSYYTKEHIEKIIPKEYEIIDFFDLDHPTVKEVDSKIRIYHFVLKRVE